MLFKDYYSFGILVNFYVSIKMIIRSILDNDFYKFTMMYAVQNLYPQVRAEYRFINRTPQIKFDTCFLEALKKGVQDLEKLKLTDDEYDWLESLDLFPKNFLDTLWKFRYNIESIDIYLDKQKQLHLAVKDNWWKSILLEVPLLALITENYFQDKPVDLEDYYKRTYEKGKILSSHGCNFAEYGTRRRRSFEVQKTVLSAFMDLGKAQEKSTYMGTSNVYFSKFFNTRPLGTVAHEWIMAHGGLFGLKGANKKAFEAWLDVFNGNHAIALTDTYTSDSFFGEFTPQMALIYSGLRQDSGDPFLFVDKAERFYKSLNIDPTTKKIIFSDSLTVGKVLKIENYVAERFQCAYGIGTHFTNDLPEEKALNVVIKLYAINEQKVYKTTDSSSKRCFVV